MKIKCLGLFPAINLFYFTSLNALFMKDNYSFAALRGTSRHFAALRGTLKIFGLLAILLIFDKTCPAQNVCPWPVNNIKLCDQYPNFETTTQITSPTFTSGLSVTGWTGKKVFINSLLTVNTHFTILDCAIKFGPHGSIQVIGGGKLSSFYSKYFSENVNGWNGILIEEMGQLEFENNFVEDARKAIQIYSSSSNIIIAFNSFNRNDIGIYIRAKWANALIIANQFNCTSPLYCPIGGTLRSTAGIYLDNTVASIGAPLLTFALTTNGFRNMQDGIYSSSSLLNFNLGSFNCNVGNGIHAIGGTANISGAVNFWDASQSFKNTFDHNRRDVRAEGVDLNLAAGVHTNCETNNIESALNQNAEEINIHNNNLTIDGGATTSGGVGVVPNSKTGITLTRSTAINHVQWNRYNNSNLLEPSTPWDCFKTCDGRQC